MAIKRITVGPFVLRLDKDEVVVVSDRARKTLEEALSRVETPSRIVRLDMAPWEGEGTPSVYEADTYPDGLWAWALFRELPQEVISLADVALCLDIPSWEALREAYVLLAEQTGWRLVHSWKDILPENRVYFTGERHEVDRALRWTLVTDPFCSKDEIIKITGGLTAELDRPPGINLSDLTKKFPTGIVLKPCWGWGSKDVYPFPMGPGCGWMRGHAGVKRDFLSGVLKNGSEELVAKWGNEWLVQPFFPPEPVRAEGRLQFRIWRIFAIRQNLDEPFRLIGGLWNQRPSLKVHGASNTLSGLIVFEEKDRKPTKINPFTPPKKEKYTEAGGWYW